MNNDFTVDGLVLAGGRARRMGGRDKGLITLCGKPLVEHVIECLGPQVRQLRISANRHEESYAAFGLPVIADGWPGFLGPLAGIARALETADAPWLVTLPCDAPLAPPDMVTRLQAALDSATGTAAVAHDGERLQPLFALLHCSLLPGLQDFLQKGGRSVQDWLESVAPLQVDFSDGPAAFSNINSPNDLAAMQEALSCSSRQRPKV